MVAVNLTQAEADALIAMEKRRIDDTEWSYPPVYSWLVSRCRTECAQLVDFLAIPSFRLTS